MVGMKQSLVENIEKDAKDCLVTLFFTVTEKLKEI
jgi:hypothetical protein